MAIGSISKAMLGEAPIMSRGIKGDPEEGFSRISFHGGFTRGGRMGRV
jgi:hypothetical protein